MQPAGKGREKKTLGSPLEKGGKRKEKKKTPVLTMGSPPEKGEKKKKTLVLTLGSPPEKGGEKKKKNLVHLSVEVLKFRASVEVLFVGFQDLDRRTDGQGNLLY
jgi:hypothetical protein